MSAQERIEALTQRIGQEILDRIQRSRPSDFAARLDADPLVSWSRRGPEFLANVFRFIDVLPAISSDTELRQYAEMYLGGASALGAPEAVRTLAANLQSRFIAGRTAAEALATCRALRSQRLAFTLDVLGEAVMSEKEADDYLNAYLQLIPSAAREAALWAPAEQLDRSFGEGLPRLNLSIKLTSLYSRFDAIDPEGSFQGVAPRLRRILSAARQHGASVNVDMEQYVFKDLTLDIFKRVMMEKEFRTWPHASITIQTYLASDREDLAVLADWARERGTPVHVRLAKGAYWDHEVQQAKYNNWPVPVYTEKERTDADFEVAAQFLLEQHKHLRPAIAGHNVRSVAHAMSVAGSLGLPRDAVEYQTLYGLGDEIKRAVADLGYRMRVYVPFGGLIPGMAYLVRRLLEATSRSAFLRQMWTSPLPATELLKAPTPHLPPAVAVETSRAGLDTPFRNELPADFSKHEARDRMRIALEEVGSELGGTYPLWIAGKAAATKAEIVSTNPARKDQIVGHIARASRRDAARAVRAALRIFPEWAVLSAHARGARMLEAASIMRRRRFELAAWEVFEEGKSWREADGDVVEAIDYLEFYAREAVRLAATRQRKVAGERNAYFYEPRGVAVTITPWNFPLAILTGVVSAAAVAGNAVIMKPAEQSSVVAAKLMEVLSQAGLPPGVVQYLPGLGEEAGEYLVRHPDVSVIAFTGSQAVGTRIARLAASISPKARQLKRVIAEMGGKNAIVVDRDADLDQAVLGVYASAFGYQGQKCSACSRAIVHRDVYDRFLERLVEAARSLPMGPPENLHNVLGPLISREALERVTRYVELGRQSARVAFEGDAAALQAHGHYVAPVIFADVDPNAVIAQEEIFGPVLCVMPARDFDEALALANGTPFGLAAGLYSRNPRHMERAQNELQAGNIYVNRKITGAVVDRQPFGGAKLSGIGSKAGGPDYLLQFMQPKTFSEYTVRRGFTPPEE